MLNEGLRKRMIEAYVKGEFAKALKLSQQFDKQVLIHTKEFPLCGQNTGTNKYFEILKKREHIQAIAITRGFVAPNGIDLIAIPAFMSVDIDGEEKTAIKFIVEPK